MEVKESNKKVFRAKTSWWSNIDLKIATLNRMIRSGDKAKKDKANQ
jgi:hypothetical protein